MMVVKSKNKINYIFIVIIAILLITMLVLIVFKTANSTLNVSNHIFSFSAINIFPNYTGFMSGYFTNQTFPHISINGSGNQFAVTLYFTNNNELHNVSINNISVQTDGFRIISLNSKLPVIIKPNQTVSISAVLISSNFSYAGDLKFIVSTGSFLNVPENLIPPTNTNSTQYPNVNFGCLKTYLYHNGRYIPYNDTPYVLNPNYYYFFTANTTENNTIMSMNIKMSGKEVVALMNNTAYYDWTTNGGTVPNNSPYNNYTQNVNTNVTISAGHYYLVIWNNGSTNSDIDNASYSIYKPFVNVNAEYSGLPAPIGLASYGLTNASGVVSPFCIKTSALLGKAIINNITAFYSLPDSGVVPNSASLQLNGVLVVNNYDNKSESFWVQNVIDIMPFSNSYYYSTDVYNYSGDRSILNNQSIQGSGTVVGNASNTTENSYFYSTNIKAYKYPLQRNLLLSERVVNGVGLWIYFYASSNMTDPTTYINTNRTYDRVFIFDPNIKGAYFLTSGYNYNPSGDFYDTEFVSGGMEGGQYTSFSMFNSKISLLFYNSTNNLFMLFPAYYNFGSDTAESAYDLNVTAIGNGYYEVYNSTNVSLRYLG